MTLTNLEKVSASLGAKAILWELFNFNPPSLRLYVDLCATSQFLSQILISNPGMIDDLMDSLVVDRPLPGAAIKAELAELVRGAEDLAPILLSFRNKEWIRIGTRDILGREPIRQVTRELADVAEAIVTQVARDQWKRRSARYGIPVRPSDGRRDRWAILALGKLGGRELNYHSDLDLVFLHEEDGKTAGSDQASLQRAVCHGGGPAHAQGPGRRLLNRPALSHGHAASPPSGRPGPLVVTLSTFRHYFEESALVWERLALTRARVIFATGGFGRHVTDTIRSILCIPVDRTRIVTEVVAMRRRLEETRGRSNQKRGFGGLTDLEFIVQFLMLIHASDQPDLLRPNLWDALDALHRAGILPADVHAELRDAYDFLRTIEGRLRLIHNRARRELPDNPADLVGLARRLNDPVAEPDEAVAAFLRDAARHTSCTRTIFEEYVGPLHGGA